MNNELEKILDKCTPWGSRAWGLENTPIKDSELLFKESDYDYVCTDEVYKDIICFLKSNYINYEEYEGMSTNKGHRIFNNNNLKFSFNNKNYNIISFDEDNLIAVDLSNQYMNALVKDKYFKSALKIKTTRIYFIETFLNGIINGYEKELRKIRAEDMVPEINNGYNEYGF